MNGLEKRLAKIGIEFADNEIRTQNQYAHLDRGPGAPGPVILRAVARMIAAALVEVRDRNPPAADGLGIVDAAVPVDDGVHPVALPRV